MSKIRVLNDNDIKKILDLKSVVRITEDVYKMKELKNTKLFPIISEEIKEGESEFDIKSGILFNKEVFGLKLVSWFSNNKKDNIPSINGMSMIFDLKNGLPIGLLNAQYLTAMRTGAAGAIGSKYLSKKYSKSLLIVGTGNQAVFQIAANLSEIETIEKVYVYNPLSYQRAVDFVESIKNKLSKIIKDISDKESIKWKSRISKVEFITLNKLDGNLSQIDIIITVTPSYKALIDETSINSGVHFSCIGSDVSGKQELDEKIFKNATIYVDDINQSINFGETQKAYELNLIDKSDINEIGELILKNKNGRKFEEDITIFDTTGIALQDIVVSKYLIDKAEELNIGNIIDI